MGVENKTVIMVGKNIGKDGYKKIEKFDENLTDSEFILYDGMCGKYCYFGYVLSELDDDNEIFELNEYNIEQIDIDGDEEFEKIVNLLDIKREDMGIVVIKHYY